MQKEILSKFCHESLKRLGCVFQAKWHSEEFKKADCSFWYVVLADWDLVETKKEVYL